MREYRVAKSGGFCFGVKRAVSIAEMEIENKNQKVYMLGEIIHNRPLIEKMEKEGGITIETLSEIEKKDNAKVLIRAHGLPKNGYDEIKEQKLQFVDATCPFVKKIHSIVASAIKNGEEIIIIGDKNHPEVIGINGWCDNKAHIVLNDVELKNLIDGGDLTGKQGCLVAQTTINRKNYENCVTLLNKVCTSFKIFDTICSATNERQEEALSLSKQCDLMVIIGSGQSSNTVKLVEICKINCENVFLVETVKDLPIDKIKNFEVVGLTAGASTPAFIIKEVVEKMEDIKNTGEDFCFEEALEQSLKTLNTGDIVTGMVVAVAPNEIQVSLGVKADGYIPVGEFTDDTSVDINTLVKVGDEVEAFVVRVNDVEGIIMLSKKKVDSIKGFKKVEGALDTEEVLKGKIIEAVKGGVIALVEGVRVFVPASLASERYTADLSSLVGKPCELKIIEINPQRRRVTGSIKAVMDVQRKINAEKTWETIEEGKEYTGVVKSIASYGAFVDIGGVDGMVHISELSWGRIKHPSDVVAVGDEIQVFVLSADKETKKISLGYKKASDNPWSIFASKYAVGDTVSCKIVKLMPFGAFAEIMPGIDGLIHISQISTKRIAKPDEILKAGEEVEAKLVEIDNENKKINLSIRALIEEKEAAIPEVNVEGVSVEA